jgi:hypothetical protein
MCSPELVLAGGTVAAGMMGAQAQAKQAGFDSAMAAYNARVDRNLAKDIERAGTEAMIAKDVAAKQLKGQQRAIAAARGVDVDVGTPLKLQQDVDFMAELDKLNIKKNVAKKAAALRKGAAITELTAEYGAKQSRLGQYATLIGTGTKAFQYSGLDEGLSGVPETPVASKWYDLPENQIDVEDITVEIPDIDWQSEWKDIYAQ